MTTHHNILINADMQSTDCKLSSLLCRRMICAGVWAAAVEGGSATACGAHKGQRGK